MFSFLQLNLEKIVLIILGLSFFIGIWHALPLTNIVTDENYFVGGVLRAIENKSIIPQTDDVPYGTLTYLLNYILIGTTLAILWPFFGFSVEALKLALVENPGLIYWVPRFLSAVLGIGFLFLINSLLKREVTDIKSRLFFLILIFTNIITVTVLHTGKVWVLSTLLVIASFYFLYKRNFLGNIICSFLAFANFPLAGFSLIGLPIIAFAYKKDKAVLKKIAVYALIGFAIYAIITLINFNGVKNQVLSIYGSYLTSTEAIKHNADLLQSFLLNFKKFFALFPLIILTLAIVLKNGIKNKWLFRISLSYLVVYFTLIVGLTRWATDFQSALRYLFPLGFFLIPLTASFNLKFKKIFYVIGMISIIYFLFTIYYLAAPTTYNLAYGWILENLNRDGVVIVNRGLDGEIYRGVDELRLPLNRRSALFVDKSYCASQCENVIDHDLNSQFKPLVIDPRSRIISTSQLPAGSEIYYLDELPQNESGLAVIKKFGNEFTDSHRHYSVDYSLGNYFDLNFFQIKNLGKPVYLYKGN